MTEKIIIIKQITQQRQPTKRETFLASKPLFEHKPSVNMLKTKEILRVTKKRKACVKRQKGTLLLSNALF